MLKYDINGRSKEGCLENAMSYSMGCYLVSSSCKLKEVAFVVTCKMVSVQMI